MLLYNVRLALKSLRRTPWLTTIVISGIALGICISTTFIALRYVFEKDPLPGRSDKLFYVRLDNWDPARAYPPGDEGSLPPQLTYRDLRELRKSDIPTRQTASYRAMMFVHPDPKIGRPYQETVRLATSDFFPMFGVPFQYGSGWDRSADAKAEPVIVIDDATNTKLFGGENSVGRNVRIDDRTYRVVGVLEPWRPAVRYWEMFSNAVAPPEAVFMPFDHAIAREVRTTGNTDNWKSIDGDGYQARLESEMNWIQYWVELPTPEKQQAFRDLLTSHIQDQKKIGRFPRPLFFKMLAIPALMEEYGVTPRQVKAMSTVSLLFLVVCSLNLVGLLLGKFLGRIPEISVRRALGASRLQVFWQHIVECEVIGVIGGVIGMLLAVGTLKLIGKVLPNGDAIGLSVEMVLASIFLSLVAGLLAGLYPAWRVCTIPPAMQLKLQ
jgi:putative ABC transport system permease protein